MRVIVSALTEHPVVWKVTKIENSSPLGIQKLTLYSNFYNSHTDYVNLETGEMYADYYEAETQPTEDDSSTIVPTLEVSAIVKSSTGSIKIGGSYKTLTLNFVDSKKDDITSSFEDATIEWFFEVDEQDVSDLITKKEISFNQIKIKLADDSSLLGNSLTIRCRVSKDSIEDIESNSLQIGIEG